MTTALELLTDDDLKRCCPPDADDEPSFGTLSTPQGNLPLKLMNIHARVTGLLAQTELRQTFVNTLGVPIEATYIFPLPDRAAVSAFRFEVGERVIDGVLKERGAARREYDQAIQAGHRAAITEEERPGVFTMRVGNLMPSEEATVLLTLDGPLPYSEGEATFRFPLVVAPRYIPGATLDGTPVGDGVAFDTDAVPDASRISPPVLLPGFPNPVRLGLSVELDPGGLPLGAVRSSLHAVSESGSDALRRIAIQPGERLNRDFILRFGLGGEQVRSSLTLHGDADGEGQGTFQLTVVPPAGQARGIKPRDVVVVLDRSGSMRGWKMVAARRATGRMLDTLTDSDRFAVLAFDNRIERPQTLAQQGLVPATNRNRFRAIEFLAKLEARGGTEMARPLEQAMGDLLAKSQSDPDRDRVLILVTDGQVGNEDQILKTLGADLERVRVFSLGIDRAVNAGFLKRLASMGGGYCELVESEDRLDDVMDKVHRRIGTPLLTHLRIEGQGLEVLSDTLAPARLPDLFAGTPLRIQGRYRGRPKGALQVKARDAVGRDWSESVSAQPGTNSVITKVWARGRIRDMEDRYAVHSQRELAEAITALSLRFSVLCRFTAFVAVDRAEVVNAGGEVHKVTQAVDQPEGWDRGAEQAAPDPFAALGGAMVCRAIFDDGAGAADFEAPPPPAARAPARPSQSRKRMRRPAPTKSPPSQAPSNRMGFLGRMAMGGNKPTRPTDKAKRDDGFDLGPYLRRIADLLELLEGGQASALGLRQQELARLLTLLETLLEDLRSVGAAAAQLQPLQTLVRALAVSRGAQLDAGTLAQLESQARDALQAFRDHDVAEPAGDREQGFWF